MNGFHAYAPAWPELDTSLFGDAHDPVPAFPLELLPHEWSRWISDTAQAVGTSADYVALGVLAATAAVTGAGVRIRVSPSWSESLVLWLALVGTPSSGKSPALASVRTLLDDIEHERRRDDGARRRRHVARVEDARLNHERWQEDCETANKLGRPVPDCPDNACVPDAFVPSQVVVADATMEALADVVAGNPRGVVLWRDELTAWLANLNRYANGGSDRAHWLEAWAAAGVTVNRRSRPQPLHLAKFPVSVVGSVQPDRLAETLSGSDDGMAARFLYTWPQLPKYTSLLDRRIPNDDTALAMLTAIAAVAGDPEQPLTLAFDDAALRAFDAFLERLHAESEAEGGAGLFAGWLGKGRGTVARLAGALALLDWSERATDPAPHIVDQTTVEAACTLWRAYFRPHAETVFAQAGKTDRDRHARKAVRWLRATKPSEVGTKHIRREALSQAVDVAETETVIARLEEAGFLRPAPTTTGPLGGRPVKRWHVNPAVRR